MAAIAALTRQHPNTIREHLDGLVVDRLADRTRAPAKGRGRPAWLYGAVPEAGSEPGSREYAALASVLAAHIARSSLQPRADAIEAGRMWGRELVGQSRTSEGRVSKEGRGSVGAESGAAAPSALVARREVVNLLDGLGFAPTANARVTVVKLHRCPLLEAAHLHPEVVCGVHLGIVRGALDELGVDPDRTESSTLQPFSEPGACRLDLLPRATTTP